MRIAFWIGLVGIVDEDDVRRPAHHPGFEHLAEDFLFIPIALEQTLYPLVGNGNRNITIDKVARVALRVVFGAENLGEVGVIDGKVQGKATTSYTTLGHNGRALIKLSHPWHHSSALTTRGDGCSGGADVPEVSTDSAAML